VHCKSKDPRSPRPALAGLLLAGLVLLGSALGGCSAGSDDEPVAPSTQAAAGEGGVTVLQPGRPGEQAETVGPDAVPESTDWNHSDVAFVQMMVPHHEQALVMSGLAPSRSTSPQVRALARRIKGSQGPEVLVLASWLQSHDIDVPRAGEDPMSYDHGEHGHTPMEGMLTEPEMTQLAATTGTAFDKMFLTRMIAHHQGAVQMAQTVAVDGTDLRVSEIAADMTVGQQAEINRMRDLLTSL
jgi:uncharacterized protein (DUF305 family)